jgi:hypothetical protein
MIVVRNPSTPALLQLYTATGPVPANDLPAGFSTARRRAASGQPMSECEQTRPG